MTYIQTTLRSSPFFESKSERKRINKAVMEYFEKKYGDHEDFKKMPFDMKRMAYGGFKAEVEA